MNYKNSGVDLHEQDVFNVKLCNKMPWLGGPAGAFDIGDDYLVSSTNGVGTKIKLFIQAQKENGVSINNIGIDLVAMVMNDIICTGAKPLFFNDYLAVNKLNEIDAEGLIDGINQGLRQCGDVPLISGDTAIMPGMYNTGEFDISGFATAVCPKSDFIDGTAIEDGDVMIGLKSSGFHSNGYTLIRDVLKTVSVNDYPTNIFSQLLRPSKIYVQSVLSVIRHSKGGVHGIAHITGGGRANVDKLLGEDLNLRPEWFEDNHKTDEMLWIQKHGNIDDIEMKRVFNNGIGMVLIVSRESAQKVIELFQAMGESPVQVGYIKKRMDSN